MPHIKIDRIHSFAIAREIGERLRPMLNENDELPVTLEKQMHRLRETEQSPSIIPSGEEHFPDESDDKLRTNQRRSWFGRRE
jgi:hypothetical protein